MRTHLILCLLFFMNVFETLCFDDLENLDSWECSVDGTCNDAENGVKNEKCHDLHDGCLENASKGECQSNQSYMMKVCAKSCGFCNDFVPESKIMELLKKFGKAQRVEVTHAKETFDVMKNTLRYMRNLRNYSPEKAEKCRNLNELCSFWAVHGECKNNSVYMNKNCGPSCESCDAIIQKEEPSTIDFEILDDVMEAIKEYGEEQTVSGENAAKTYATVVSTLKYMMNVEGTIKEEYFKECCNKNKLCAFWASIGQCESNIGYMKVNCAPSCKSCHMIDYDTRCPPRDPSLEPALTPFDLDRLFEGILHDDQHKVIAYSKPDLNVGTDQEQPPWVITIDDFLSDEECDILSSFGKKVGYSRSMDVGELQTDGSYSGIENDRRTSENAWCSKDCRNDTIVKQILNRIQNTLNIPMDNFEDFQILRYELDQFYKQHHDFIHHQVDRNPGPRILTFFLYLSDVEEGGETSFPKLNIKVKPKKGRVLLWPSVLSSNPESVDDRMDHEALPVIKGTKFAANAWIHLYDYMYPHSLGLLFLQKTRKLARK